MVCLPLHGCGLPVPGRNLLFLCFYNVKQNSGKLFDQFWIPRVPFIYHHSKVVVVKMLKFGHFGLKIGPLRFWNLTQNPWDYETRAQELTSGAICMFLSFFGKIWEYFKDRRVKEKKKSSFLKVHDQLQTDGIFKRFEAQRQDCAQIQDFLKKIKMLMNLVYLS